MRRSYVPMLTSILFCSLMLLLIAKTDHANAAPSPQKGGKGRYAKKYKEIKLTKNARKNGYTCVQDGDAFKFEAENVIDPLTGQPLKGKHKLEFRCKPGEVPMLKQLLFLNGRSNTAKIECLIIITPKIIITEE